MKTLMVLSAPPASGKSTWSRMYKESHDNVYIISSDGIREELTGSLQDFSCQDKVWETFNKRIKEYSYLGDDITVILDSLCDLNWIRKKYVLENPEYDRYVLIYFKPDKEQELINNKMRKIESIVPDDAMIMLINKFEELDDETRSLYDEIIDVEVFGKHHG